jgi:hypothetical protein
MGNLTDDHELHNFHLGHVNKKVNDLKEMMHKKEDKEKIVATEDVSDIEPKLSDGVDPYLIMIGEFRSTGPLLVHIIQKGDNKGKTSKKQTWEHVYLGNKFVWHYVFNQSEFAKDKPWKVAREILKKSMTEWQSVAVIMKAAKMPVSN